MSSSTRTARADRRDDARRTSRTRYAATRQREGARGNARRAAIAESY